MDELTLAVKVYEEAIEQNLSKYHGQNPLKGGTPRLARKSI